MKYRIETAPLIDYYVIVVKDMETGELIEAFTLNESGKDILSLFCQGMDANAVAKKLSEMYDVPIEQVSKDVVEFAKRLNKKVFWKSKK